MQHRSARAARHNLVTTPMSESPVQKALLILRQLAEHGAPVGVKQIAGDLAMNVSTVHRMLQVLVKDRMASYDPDTRLYGIGTDSMRFAAKVLGSGSEFGRIRPILRELAELLQETCAFGLYEPETFTKVIVLVERSSQPLGYDFAVGSREGIHAGASGKAILAMLADDDVERMFASVDMTPSTENTITDPVRLRKELKVFRSRGYATSEGERVPGSGIGVAAAVCDGDGRVKGSIIVTVPMFRWRKSKLPAMSKAVVACARSLSGLVV